MIPLILFSIVGLMYIRSPNFTPFMPFGFAGVTLAVTLFFWSFTGFETVVVPSQEVRKPSRTIPWAMILTMAITMVAYVVCLQKVLDKSGIEIRESFRSQIPFSVRLSNL
ncbi:hypothetical protein LCGC14_1768340 [marine sediment metagenome]|uniref:Amino acid permease/ SLC12A domain-containing protein n=1 Tax=marine sediment metagenome TaxID=412755 RepID=A0A0F9GZ05_9ZZZZ